MKSLELNWIRRKVDKSLVIPDVIYNKMQYSGLYHSPEKNELYDIDGHPHDMQFGIISINPDYIQDVETIIAHEWRHHWQLHNGWIFDNININWNYQNPEIYSKQLKFFFESSKSEMDALLFERKYTTISPEYEEWIEVNIQH